MDTAEVQTRIAISNILVPIDFSQCSERAMLTARGIARRSRGRIYVTHVVDPTVLPLTSPEAATSLRDAARAKAAAEMHKIEDEGLLNPVRHELLLREGPVWAQLESIIREKHVDLIVTGTHGPSGFSKLALGSVAEEIFRNSPCPVITVGPLVTSECFADADMRVILYATDFSPQSLEAAAFAFAMAREHGAKLVLLHVVETPIEHTPAGLADTRDFYARELRKLVPEDAELWSEPEYHVEFGDPAATILETASAVRANLIVLGVLRGSAVSTHMPWAIASQVVRQSPCPVLTVRSRLRHWFHPEEESRLWRA